METSYADSVDIDDMVPWQDMPVSFCSRHPSKCEQAKQYWSTGQQKNGLDG